MTAGPSMTDPGVFDRLNALSAEGKAKIAAQQQQPKERVVGRTMRPYTTAARLFEAADLIRDASRILDEVVVCSPKPAADRIEAVPGVTRVTAEMADAIRALADAIQGEYEAECERAEAELEAIDLDAPMPELFSPQWFAQAAGLMARDQKGAA